MVKIGWIGTGVMGSAMCMHLLSKNHECYVYNRSKSKTDLLIKQGAILCKSPAEVAKNAKIVFSMVGYPSDVKEIMLGPDGVFSSISSDSIIIDMTSSTPTLAKELYSIGKKKGIEVLDAPVSGGDIGAREAKLSIMVGGDKKTFDKIHPYFEIMGKNINYMGPASMGQHTKMANQISVAAVAIGTVETLLYAQRCGLDLLKTIEVVEAGAGGSWALTNLGRKIVNGNYVPGFFIKHFIKDMGIILDECEEMKLKLPGLENVHSLYQKAKDQGLENLGTQALYKVLEQMNSK